MTVTAWVNSCRDEQRTAYLAADTTVGALALAVDTTAGFTLGTVSLGGALLMVVGMDEGTLILDPATPVAAVYETGFPVVNFIGGTAEVERVADVSFNDGGDVEALVPTSMAGYLPLRDYDDDPVPVEVELVDRQWRVVRLVGTPPVLDGQVVWNPHSFRVKGVTLTSTIPASTHTQVLGWTNVETDGVTFASGTWTIVTPAWYNISVWLTWTANTTGRRRLRILVNNVPVRISVVGADPDIETYSEASVQARLIAGDVVTAWVFQSSGGSLNISDGAFSIYRISA